MDWTRSGGWPPGTPRLNPRRIWSVTWHFRRTESPGNRHTTEVFGTPSDLPGLAEAVSLAETGGITQAQYIEIDGCSPVD